ncbi:hypothetical protein OG552_00100 [Streptomyces sp. NBC_01476]|uniref:hypothetical protein n=1 Tax=Streptomyces sp. NBC_01476 TaxID=2903881 RepID=UPI002E33C645|nr:hypothetical protein [Streptomyces sp. NBC_01476]
MSANHPPSQAGGQNSFGPQPGGTPRPPHGVPNDASGFSGPAAPASFAPPPVAQFRNNPVPGLLVGVLVAIVAALAYAGLLRVLVHDNGSTTELGYGPLAVGALVGITVGKAGGRNIILPIAASLLTVFAVIFGDLFGTALIESHMASKLGGSLPVTDIVFHHWGSLWKAWKHDFDVKRLIALWFAALAAYELARRFGDN